MRLLSADFARVLAPALSLALAVPSATPLGAQAAQAAQATQTEERGAFVVRLGVDTLGVENFARSKDRVVVDAVVRTPTTVVRHYELSLTPTGAPAKLVYEGRRVNNSGPPTLATVTFGRDTTVMDLKLGDSTATMRIAARDPIPYVNNAFAMIEVATRQAAAAKKDSLAMTLVPLGSPQTTPLPMARRGKDTLTIWYFGDPMHARVDKEGRILGLEGLSTTNKVVVDRVPVADLAAFTTAWVARDSAGRGVGQLSPRDSLAATVGNAHVTVNYGRPSKRGRKIFGGVVPYDQVWRTGANAATAFTTDAPLQIGGTTVPAGSYTLFTLPSRSGWKLIINKQTGQWGTEYHSDQDLARVNLSARALAEPVEQFTIGVEPSGSGGVLKMTWDDTELSVPITPKG
jgi:hypothetical protein